MKKTIACRDLGIDCPFVAKGDTEEEVVEKITEHGKTTHPKEVEGMMKNMTGEQMKELMKSKIKEE